MGRRGLLPALGALLLALAVPCHGAASGLKMPSSFFISGDMSLSAEGTVYNYQTGSDLANGRWFTKRLGASGGDQLIQHADGWIYLLVSNNQTAPNNWDCWSVNTTMPAPKIAMSPNSTMTGEVLLRGNKVTQFRKNIVNETNPGNIIMVADTFFDTSGPLALFKGMSSSPSGNFFNAATSTATAPPASHFDLPASCTKPGVLKAEMLGSLGAFEIFPDAATQHASLYASLHNSQKARHGYSLKAFSHPHPKGLQLAVGEGEGLRKESLAGLQPYRPGLAAAAIPESVDRVAEGWTTTVRDQGSCGGCWAFATAAALEVNTGMARGRQMPQISTQQLIDCARGCDGFEKPICLAPTRGCHGGWPPVVYRWLRQHGSLSLDADYPYRATESACAYNAKGSGSSPVDFQYILPGNETMMKAAVAEHGSVTVVISTPMTFELYEEGVFDDPKCGRALNHAVTVVGYGHDDVVGKDYWLVKNSWSNRWGMDGYVKMVRGKNMCGIADWAFALIPSA